MYTYSAEDKQTLKQPTGTTAFGRSQTEALHIL